MSTHDFTVFLLCMVAIAGIPGVARGGPAPSPAAPSLSGPDPVETILLDKRLPDGRRLLATSVPLAVERLVIGRGKDVFTEAGDPVLLLVTVAADGALPQLLVRRRGSSPAGGWRLSVFDAAICDNRLLMVIKCGSSTTVSVVPISQQEYAEGGSLYVDSEIDGHANSATILNETGRLEDVRIRLDGLGPAFKVGKVLRLAEVKMLKPAPATRPSGQEKPNG